MEYIVIGDTDTYKGCLVCVLGLRTKEQAEEMLQKMIENPTNDDRQIMKGHHNFRIKEVADNDCWWRKGY